MESTSSHHPSRSAFTLIELLVVIAIIAILAVVVVLTLNPAQLLAQSRDANRVSDMSTLNDALNLYTTDQAGASSFSLGSASTTYISVPDPAASSTCGSLGLPSLPTSTAYHCAASTTFRSVAGTGWLPVNFSNITAGAPFGSLPVDQINTTSSGDYYAYLPGQTSAGTYELISRFESQKYTSLTGVGSQTGGYSDQYDQVGKDLTLALTMPEDLNRVSSSDYLSFDPLGLVGYWPLNEGSQSTAYDLSGNGNNGAWSGNPAGTSGYYSPGYVGKWAGAFDGSSTTMTPANNGAYLQTATLSVSFWLNQVSGSNGTYYLFGFGYMQGWNVVIGQTTNTYLSTYSGGTQYGGPGIHPTLGSWTFITETYDGTYIRAYTNGTLTGTSGAVPMTYSTPTFNLLSLHTPANPMLIQDVRLYNRVLSAQEIQAMYIGGL